jgi:hypothetical protein
MFGTFDLGVVVVVAQIPLLVRADGLATARADDLLATLDASIVFTPSAAVPRAVELALATVPHGDPPAMGGFLLDCCRLGCVIRIRVNHAASASIGGKQAAVWVSISRSSQKTGTLWT